MKNKSSLLWLLILIGLAGVLGCGAMTVMAVQYHEWGRVALYGFLTVLSLELLIVAVMKCRKN